MDERVLGLTRKTTLKEISCIGYDFFRLFFRFSYDIRNSAVFVDVLEAGRQLVDQRLDAGLRGGAFPVCGGVPSS